MHTLTTPDLERIGAEFGLRYEPSDSYPFLWRARATVRHVLVLWGPAQPHAFAVHLFETQDDGTRKYDGSADFVFERGETSGPEETLRRLLGWANERGYGCAAEVTHVW